MKNNFTNNLLREMLEYPNGEKSDIIRSIDSRENDQRIKELEEIMKLSVDLIFGSSNEFPHFESLLNSYKEKYK